MWIPVAALLWLSPAMVLAALLLHDGVLVSWSLAQLVKALWPWRSELAANIDGWAWSHWEAERSGLSVEAEAVPELAKGTVPSDRQRPFVIRGLLNGSSNVSLLDYQWLMQPPVGDLVVDYFTNASAVDGIVPDARAPLETIVRSIIAGGSAKIGTQLIFNAFPRLLDELGIGKVVGPLVGGAEHVASSRLGSRLTIPVWMATGAPSARTDLHCEPIGNLMLQLGGRKRWTLVPPEESRFLRPSISKDGRAYFQSNLPTEASERVLAHVHRWLVECDSGDALWVPTWTWHRVDYLTGITALSASLFHFRVEQVRFNALYMALTVPNIIKELIGWKTQ